MSKELASIEQYLKEAPLKESGGDGVIIGVSPSPNSMEPILVEALDFVPTHLPTPHHSPFMRMY